jgi:hypothetical protein
MNLDLDQSIDHKNCYQTMEKLMEYVATLPRNSQTFYLTLPRNLIGIILGLCMAVAGVVFSSGGCSNDGVKVVPLSRWLSLFGTLYMMLYLVQLIMGIMMFSHAENLLKTSKKDEVHDVHMLDIVYLVLSVPVILFLICFFIIGNTWFLSFDFNTASFLGANAYECRECLTVGTTCIVLVWASIPACALYMGIKKKMNEEKSEKGKSRKKRSSDIWEEEESLIPKSIQEGGEVSRV